MKLSELEEEAAAASSEDEFGEDEGEVAQDLGEALELLGDCQEMLERLLRKTAKRRPLNVVDVKDVTDLSQEVMAFISQWAMPGTDGEDKYEDAPSNGVAKEVDEEYDY